MTDGELLKACAIARRGDCPDVMTDIDELPAEIESDRRYTRALEERSQWQPIESQPEHATYVLLFSERGVETGWIGKGVRYNSDPPTHWMPLPESPK